MFDVNPKTVAGVRGTDENRLAYVLERAIELQEALYEFNGSPRPIEHRGLGRVNRCLFRLRKALEGIWGKVAEFKVSLDSNDSCSLPLPAIHKDFKFYGKDKP